jgi:hypothetical protein
LSSLLFFKAEGRYRYLGISSGIIVLLILVLRGKAYYMLGLTPVLFAFGGYALEKYMVGKLKWMNYGLLTISLIFSLLALPFGLPILSFERLDEYSKKTGNIIIAPFSRWEDGEKHLISQVYSDMTGWKELTQYVARAYYQLSEEEQQLCTIYGERNYGYAGAINFYGRAYRLPEAITFLESYVIWAPDSIPNGPIIYINKDQGDMPKLFNNVTEIGQVDNKYFRENGLKVFLCKLPKVDIQKVYENKAQEEKRLYR